LQLTELTKMHGAKVVFVGTALQRARYWRESALLEHVFAAKPD